ncbi:hypothetical protein KGM_200278 [Danaus plexippus plexippus]|uniref:N-acylneuraminate cytidylyltransferase n=1 Tax=Danaus plexippus plexippus TaxID=278856 RepID=A0A212FII7_DANPL|nr:hypothetical protein KGM_200278 [Danaus plexippus plexippus]
MWLVTVISVALVGQTVGLQNTAVLILARGGSKGVRLKNFQTVGGISLVGRSILNARNAYLEDITVSTDHPLIALEALKYNARILIRSYITATDWAPSIWGVEEFIETRPDVTVVVLLQVTSPLLKAKHLNLALKKLHFPKAFDCIFSVTRSYKLRWTFRNETMYPVNFNVQKRPRRQDWSGDFIETGSFYIARRKLIESGYLQNNK